MEKAALKMNLSLFPELSIEKLNEMFNGDYAGSIAKTDAAIERGVDLYLSAVGRSVEVWNKGKAKNAKVVRIDYDPKENYYILIFDDRGTFRFRDGGFSSLGHNGEFYGIYDPAVGKCGIKFL